MSVDELMFGYDLKADAIEKAHWDQSVEHLASCIKLDGIPLTEIYPRCIEKVKNSYDPTASNVNDVSSISKSLSTQVNQLELCMLYGGSATPSTEWLENDTTVDDMNPLGVT